MIRICRRGVRLVASLCRTGPRSHPGRLPPSLLRAIALAALVAASASPATASAFGDARGLVLDPQQKPISGARVALREKGSSAGRTVETDARGEFVFRALPLGEYVLSVEAAGFAKVERSLTVVSDSAPVIKVNLAIAPVAERAEVVATGTIVGSDSPTPESLVDRQQIEETPGADRSNSLAMIPRTVIKRSGSSRLSRMVRRLITADPETRPRRLLYDFHQSGEADMQRGTARLWREAERWVIQVEIDGAPYTERDYADVASASHAIRCGLWRRALIPGSLS